ncbi:hypothetical protein [Nocardia suismassiliense]|uniref:hypothetical protein n=1 Tax=Nocardia suismassiliense TaxID=2077092 RepID=UPI00131ED9D5|nr:hypothetical protein [Nocardia suismassiliense]
MAARTHHVGRHDVPLDSTVVAERDTAATRHIRRHGIPLDSTVVAERDTAAATHHIRRHEVPLQRQVLRDMAAETDQVGHRHAPPDYPAGVRRTDPSQPHSYCAALPPPRPEQRQRRRRKGHRGGDTPHEPPLGPADDPVGGATRSHASRTLEPPT